jgi:hypothetical protein
MYTNIDSGVIVYEEKILPKRRIYYDKRIVK